MYISHVLPQMVVGMFDGFSTGGMVRDHHSHPIPDRAGMMRGDMAGTESLVDILGEDGE